MHEQCSLSAGILWRNRALNTGVLASSPVKKGNFLL